MRCMHCGNEIGDDHRFCSFCGGPNEYIQQQTMPPLRQPNPRPAQTCSPARSYPSQPAARKGGTLKWILVVLWLVLAVIGWVAALVLTLGGDTAQSAPVYEAYRKDSFVTVLESDWYQWDIQAGKLYCWHFFEDGTAEYSQVGKDKWHQADYVVEENANSLAICYEDACVIWEYDTLENCFWLYGEVDGQLYKTRIFPAGSIPAGTAKDYTYRVDE